jgi:hypothetical protein
MACVPEQDLAYYTRMFAEDMRRDPTNVELFDIAQSNSEHRCHPLLSQHTCCLYIMLQPSNSHPNSCPAASLHAAVLAPAHLASSEVGFSCLVRSWGLFEQAKALEYLWLRF